MHAGCARQKLRETAGGALLQRDGMASLLGLAQSIFSFTTPIRLCFIRVSRACDMRQRRPMSRGTARMNEDLQYAVLHEFVAPARRNLSQGSWDYLMGGAETETTLERNRVALDSHRLPPARAAQRRAVDTRAKVLGQDVRLPVILAPIGSLQDFASRRRRGADQGRRARSARCTC